MAEYRTVTAVSTASKTVFEALAKVSTEVNLPDRLEYESGVWIPEQDETHGEIYFKRHHQTPPFFAVIFRDDYSGEKIPGTVGVEVITSFYDLYGEGVPYQRGTQTDYGYATKYYYGATNTNVVATSPLNKNPEDTSVELDMFNVRFYLTNTKIMPYGTDHSPQYMDYFRAGIAYKWLAVWKP